LVYGSYSVRRNHAVKIIKRASILLRKENTILSVFLVLDRQAFSKIFTTAMPSYAIVGASRGLGVCALFHFPENFGTDI